MEPLNLSAQPNRYILKRAVVSILSAAMLTACVQSEHVVAGEAITSDKVASNEHKIGPEHCAEQIGVPGANYGIADIEGGNSELEDYISDKGDARTNFITNRLSEYVSKDDTLGVSGAYGFKDVPESEAYANSVLLTDLTVKSMQEAGYVHVVPVYDTYEAMQDNIATIKVGHLEEVPCHDSPKHGPFGGNQSL